MAGRCVVFLLIILRWLSKKNDNKIKESEKNGSLNKWLGCGIDLRVTDKKLLPTGGGKKMKILTKENASTAKLIRNIKNPEWGEKMFNYNSQQLNDGECCSSWGIGCNSAILFEYDYKFWEVVK
jgi:hypothetical protein